MDYNLQFSLDGPLPQTHITPDNPQHCHHPKRRELSERIDFILNEISYPPIFHQIDNLRLLSGCVFDVILLTPKSAESLHSLPLDAILNAPGFVFAVAHTIKDLQMTRRYMHQVGLRIIEDIVILDKTPSAEFLLNTTSHCVVGLNGHLDRSLDAWFVQSNIDVDVLFHLDDLFGLIERLCRGTRRLHLFGDPSLARRGWITVDVGDNGNEDQSSNIDITTEWITTMQPLVPFDQVVDMLRPKSPK